MNPEEPNLIFMFLSAIQQSLRTTEPYESNKLKVCLHIETENIQFDRVFLT